MVLLQSTARGWDTVTQGVALGYRNIAPLGQNTQSSPEIPDVLKKTDGPRGTVRRKSDK